MPKTLLDWLLYVACYYPTTPTYYPSTKRGTSVGPLVAVNVDFFGYLRFLSIGFVWFVWVQYATDTLVKKESSLHRPLLTFQPTVYPSASYKQSYQCLNHISHLGHHAQLLCQLMHQGLWRRYILAPQRKPDLQGSCSIAGHSILSDRSEQNSSKLWHSVCDIFVSCLALKG